MDFYLLFLGILLGWIGTKVFAAIGKSPTAKPDVADSPTAEAAASAPETAPAPKARTRAIEIAKSLDDIYQQAERGSDLEQEPRFVELTTLLASDAFSAQERLAWATSQTMPLSCATLAAIAMANDDSRSDVARLIGRLGYFPAHFALKVLHDATDPSICGLVLLRAPP